MPAIRVRSYPQFVAGVCAGLCPAGRRHRKTGALDRQARDGDGFGGSRGQQPVGGSAAPSFCLQWGASSGGVIAMKLSLEEFRAWENKSVTLLGMSGVGKTHLATLLRSHDWFHYSGDYRIGTRYLGEPILDLVKQQAMQVPFLRELLRSDYIYIGNNITVDNLGPVLSFVGKPGNVELGGVPLGEFKQRQERYRRAEVEAMMDVPEFIRKAREIYGYRHFVNDVGGSLCELEEPQAIDVLVEHTLILYIEVDPSDEAELLRRAEADPKPLYYRPEFLDKQIEIYLRERDMHYVAEIDPDDCTRWVFPRLFRSRVPRYGTIARAHGYTVSAASVASVRDDTDFMDLVEGAAAVADLAARAAAR
jgi:shikimate kinase